MKTTIVSQSPNFKDLIEEALFYDISGNHWKILVSHDMIYLVYLGSDLDRKSDFKVTADDGLTLVVGHEDIFAFDNNEMNTYFHLRDVVKGSITSVIWDFIQEQLYKHNTNKRIKLNRN